MALINNNSIKKVVKNNISKWLKLGYKDVRSNEDLSKMKLLDKISVDNFGGFMTDSPNRKKDFIEIGDQIYDNGLSAEVISIIKGTSLWNIWILIDYAVFDTKEIRRRISDYLAY